MYTGYSVEDLDKKAKKAVDQLFADGGRLYYQGDHWEVLTYDFTIIIPVELPSEEHYPMLNITMTLKSIKNSEPNKVITFSEYL
jgi:hypothetical protein|tara:strand:- start:130 stop:381 length:252 start_codon:yes stop_codon:yes gene_type:complete